MNTDTLAIIESLPLDAQLSFWVGTVARRDVVLENCVREVYETLCLPGLGWASTPPQLSPLVTGLRNMLEKSRLDEGIVTEALKLLKDIKKPHEARNKIVHDMWVDLLRDEAPTFEPVRFGMMGMPDTQPRDLAFFRETAEALEALISRVVALKLVVGVTLGPPGSMFHDLDMFRAMVRGEEVSYSSGADNVPATE